MITIEKKSDCCACSACLVKCPNNCINLIPDKEGFKYPKIDKKKCNDCDICISVCPIIDNKRNSNEKNSNNENSNNKNNHESNHFDKLFYACKSKNEDIRYLSSSGGIFSLIAEETLNNNGIVFGAGFDENFTLKHFGIDNINDLDKLRGSKYVQSDMNTSFKTVENYLKEDKSVLFSGTPCQISGLKIYLGKDYENLITVDVVCHGVSSPKVFKKYLDFEKNRKKSNIKKISFRDKKKGWRKFSFTIDFEDNTQFSETLSENIYMRGFLRELYQRPACHDCEFKLDKDESDITLGDYWGIQMFHPNLDDDKGVSFVSVNTKKGNEIFKKIANKMVIEETNLDDAVKKNRCILKTVNPNRNREQFFKYIDKYPIDLLIKLSLRKSKLSKKDHLFILKEKAKRLIS